MDFSMECKFLAFLAFTAFVMFGRCLSSEDPKVRTSPIRSTQDVTLSRNLTGFNRSFSTLDSIQLLVNTFLLVSVEEHGTIKGKYLHLVYPHSLYGGEVFQNLTVNESNVWLKLPDMLSDDRLYGEYMCRAYYEEHEADTAKQNWNMTFEVTAGNVPTTKGLSMNCSLQSPKKDILWLNITRQRDNITTILASMTGNNPACSSEDEILCWLSKSTAFTQLNVHLFDGDFQETDEYLCVFEGKDGQRTTVDFHKASVQHGNITDACNQTDVHKNRGCVPKSDYDRYMGIMGGTLGVLLIIVVIETIFLVSFILRETRLKKDKRQQQQEQELLQSNTLKPNSPGE